MRLHERAHRAGDSRQRSIELELLPVDVRGPGTLLVLLGFAQGCVPLLDQWISCCRRSSNASADLNACTSRRTRWNSANPQDSWARRPMSSDGVRHAKAPPSSARPRRSAPCVVTVEAMYQGRMELIRMERSPAWPRTAEDQAGALGHGHHGD